MTRTAEQLTRSNPLVAFRVPKTLQRKFGTHFLTQRDDVINETEGLTSVYPGEFTYMKDPTLEIEIATWEDSAHPKSISMYFKMTGKDGYNVMMADEWKLADRIAIAWQKDASGRLTLKGRATDTLVLMWRTGENHDDAQKRRLRISDEIQMSAEERNAKMQDAAARLGGRLETTLEDDDGQDESPSQSRKRRN